MKKDIEIPEVTEVSLAVVPSGNSHGEKEWGVYLLNTGAEALDNVLINVSAEGEVHGVQKQTATLRFHIPKVKAMSTKKVEVILPEAFALRNKYWVSFYNNGKLFDKKFIAEPNSIIEDNFEFIPLLTAVGFILH
ncbi:MAG: hypothetical protein ACKVOR_10710 [Flavobacteriales bacterium]